VSDDIFVVTDHHEQHKTYR